MSDYVIESIRRDVAEKCSQRPDTECIIDATEIAAKQILASLDYSNDALNQSLWSFRTWVENALKESCDQLKSITHRIAVLEDRERRRS